MASSEGSVRVDIVTLFPEIFSGFLDAGFVGRARTGGQLLVRTRSLRDFGLGKHRAVDDTPYGGGSGMVMRVDVLASAMESLDADAPENVRARRILLTPQGTRFDQSHAQRLAREPAVMLVCGRYEGFDERVRTLVDEEISLGDFIMTGGEVAAMALIDACVRLLPGVLGNELSTHEESHSPSAGGLLEYPQYTRPAEFRGAKVPDVLAGGNHAEIARFRHAESIARTKARRPDLYARYEQEFRTKLASALGPVSDTSLDELDDDEDDEDDDDTNKHDETTRRSDP
jgi:tRNA (guanine37-N1)-methyltransferase